MHICKEKRNLVVHEPCVNGTISCVEEKKVEGELEEDGKEMRSS